MFDFLYAPLLLLRPGCLTPGGMSLCFARVAAPRPQHKSCKQATALTAATTMTCRLLPPRQPVRGAATQARQRVQRRQHPALPCDRLQPFGWPGQRGSTQGPGGAAGARVWLCFGALCRSWCRSTSRDLPWRAQICDGCVSAAMVCSLMLNAGLDLALTPIRSEPLRSLEACLL